MAAGIPVGADASTGRDACGQGQQITAGVARHDLQHRPTQVGVIGIGDRDRAARIQAHGRAALGIATAETST